MQMGVLTVFKQLYAVILQRGDELENSQKVNLYKNLRRWGR